jgi:hypothetical protein
MKQKRDIVRLQHCRFSHLVSPTPKLLPLLAAFSSSTDTCGWPLEYTVFLESCYRPLKVVVKQAAVPSLSNVIFPPEKHPPKSTAATKNTYISILL